MRHLAAQKRACLWDEQGLGKTVQAIRAADNVGAQRVLVLCPASVVGTWLREWEQWQQVERLPCAPTRPTLPNSPNLVAVLSYGRVLNRDLLTFLAAQPWDVLVLDEAHYLKSGRTQRTRAVLGRRLGGRDGLVGAARHVWALSGTPLPNGWPTELFPLVRSLRPESLPSPQMSGFEWERAFTAGRQTPWGFRPTGIKNRDILNRVLHGWTLRRTKAEVLPDLPDLQVTQHWVEWESEDAETLLAQARDEGITAAAEALLHDLARDPDDPSPLERRAVALSTLRRAFGVIKSHAIAEEVKDFLSGTERKLVLFGIHREVLQRLAGCVDSRLVVTLWGEHTQKQRQEAIDRFQTDPGVRLMVAQIRAGGVGVTLTAASDLWLVEPDWSPGVNAQAIHRVHRIGQTRGVQVRFVSLLDPLDQAVTKVLAEKSQLLSEVLDEVRHD